MIAGATSFIGSQIVREANAQQVVVVTAGRQTNLDDILRPGDVVVNCALHDDYRRQPYNSETDLDLLAARAAHRKGARMVMLSTRRVYPACLKWGARETDEAGGDETAYGQNKARTEAAVQKLLDEDVCIVRLSNVFGFEYRRENPRRTFLGMMLTRLKLHGEILFDMKPDTRRDFITVECAARGLVNVARGRASGVYNLASGIGMPCGSLARAVIEGYGDGVLTAPEEVDDEFYLNISKWETQFGSTDDANALLIYANRLGDQLRYA